MAQQRRHSITFKRQVVIDYLSGQESLAELSRRHGVVKNLIRIWVKKYEAGELDSELEAANLLQDYESRIAALERLVGQLTLENDLLKKAQSAFRRQSAASSSVITGPKACPSPKDAE